MDDNALQVVFMVLIQLAQLVFVVAMSIKLTKQVCHSKGSHRFYAFSLSIL